MRLEEAETDMPQWAYGGETVAKKGGLAKLGVPAGEGSGETADLLRFVGKGFLIRGVRVSSVRKLGSDTDTRERKIRKYRDNRRRGIREMEKYSAKFFRVFVTE